MYVEVGRLNLMTHLKYDRVIIMVSIAGTNAQQNIHLVNCSNLSPTIHLKYLWIGPNLNWNWIANAHVGSLVST